MRKLVLKSIIMLVLVVVMAASFASCDYLGDILPDSLQKHVHTIVIDEAVAPTCTATGLAEGKHCSVCNEVLVAQTVVEALGHTEVVDEAVAPTCTTTGLTEGKHCLECNKVLVAQRKVNKINHNYSNELTFNSTHHYYECSCGSKKDVATHVSSGTSDANDDKVCIVCGCVNYKVVGIVFETLTVNGNKVYGSVSNDTEYYSFVDEVSPNGDTKYTVSSDVGGINLIPSKTIPLNVGDNTVYITAYDNDDPIAIYQVVIRRKPIYKVTFDSNGGTIVKEQYVEEGNLATSPSVITKIGYTFLSWNFDFSTPITSDTTIEAEWSANTDTVYKVEYYLEDINEYSYSIIETETEHLNGTTDTIAYAERKAFEHFTLNTWKSTLSGNINGNGDLVLKVYYTRNTYIVSTSRNNTKGGTVIGSGIYAYDKQITFTATTNAGYTFLGWFEGETKVCDTLSYTFNVDRDVTYTAKWEANTDTAYKVEYYLENIDKNGYDIYTEETENLTGTTDTTAYAERKAFEHFTLDTSKSTLSGNINGNGDLVLKVYYTRNTYTVNSADTSTGSVSGGGNHAYDKQISVSATANLGYIFSGWYSGDELLSTSSEYTVNIDREIVAKFDVLPEMQSFYFTSTSNECKITGIKDTNVTEIVVPNYVTNIGECAFSGCSSLESITLPFVGGSKSATTSSSSALFGYIFGEVTYTGGVSTKQCYRSGNKVYDITYYIPVSLKSVTITTGNILYGAFYNCTNLTSVTIGDSITSIGEDAFYGCTSLTSVTIPDSVTSIGDYAFSDCTSLTSVTIGDSVVSVSDYAFYNCKNLTSVTIGDSVTSIGDFAFSGCTSLTSVTICDSLISIGSYAFLTCSNLTEITIPDSVTSIGDMAFNNCSGLTSVTIGNSVTSIGVSAFSDCTSLTSVTIGDSVTSISSYAFSDCTSLTSVIIGNSVTSISNNAFEYCTSLTSVTIPDSVTSIGFSAFYNCSSLESITLPFVGVTESGSSKTHFGYIFGAPDYGDNSFYVPSSLKTVIISGGTLTWIDYYAFWECASLTSVTIGNNVAVIGSAAFCNCTNLTSVTIGDSVTSIGSSAFMYCTSLTSITISNSVTSIGEDAFYNCTSLTSIVIDKNNKVYKSIDGNLYSKDGTVLIKYAIGKTDRSFVVPDSVTNIGDYAFSGCTSLTSVTIPNSVTTIGEYAFKDCYKLVEVINKSSLYIIAGILNHGYVACYAIEVHTGESKIVNNDGYLFITFGGVNYLVGYTGDNTELTLPESYNGENYEICKYAFYECSNLTSVTIPDSVTSIGSYAFSYCTNLTSVTIGNGVTSIGYSAFKYCHKLVEVINKSSLNITAGSTSNGSVACYAIEVHTGESKIVNKDNYIFYSSGGVNYLFGYVGNETALILPENYNGENYQIYKYAFYECSNLTSVTIPDSVTSIGYYAFSGCTSLTSVTIPDSVTSIGGFAFYLCDSLTFVTIGDGVTSIDYHAFYCCRKLKSVIIGNSVTSIGAYAFSGCTQLMEVTMGSIVTSIDGNAFGFCDSLTKINFNGTVWQWNTIQRVDGWNNYTGSYIIYCTNGKISKSGQVTYY